MWLYEGKNNFNGEKVSRFKDPDLLTKPIFFSMFIKKIIQ